MRHYTHLTTEEREQTMILVAQGISIRAIAAQLKRSPSTISRELKRNTKPYKAYSSDHANRAYKWRRRKCRPRYKLLNKEKAAYVEKRLRLKWSPEQIVGRAKLDGYPLDISYKTIYRAVASRVLPISLHKEMRLKSRHKIPKDCKTGRIWNVLTIHDRPSSADLECGHWESDTIHGRRGTGDIATHVERKSGFLIACKLENRKDDSFNSATVAAFETLPPYIKRSFTVDRGAEFFGHATLTIKTGMPVYFCDPGHPGQRGLNENTNGLLRQFFPKGSSFLGVSQSALDIAVALINNRPRKRFGFRSPAELFSVCCT